MCKDSYDVMTYIQIIKNLINNLWFIHIFILFLARLFHSTAGIANTVEFKTLLSSSSNTYVTCKISGTYEGIMCELFLVWFDYSTLINKVVMAAFARLLGWPSITTNCIGVGRFRILREAKV